MSNLLIVVFAVTVAASLPPVLAQDATEARKLAAKNAVAAGQKAAEAGDYPSAIKAFHEALNNDLTNEEAKAGLAAAQAKWNEQAKRQQPPRGRNIISEAFMAEFEQEMNTARDLLNQGKFPAATEAVARAQRVLDNSKQDLPPARYAAASEAAGKYLSKIREAERRNAKKPNIVLIFTDDQGYGDVSCYDNPGDIKTPNIDRIAKSGVKLTDGYSTCAICGPSRAGLMSGRYQHRFGYVTNRDVFNEGFVQQTTLPQVLKKSGYTTGMVGKWHLGRRTQERRPNNRGFDEFYGFLYSMRAYFEVESKNNPIFRNTKPIPEPKEYLTDVFSREAVAFIDRHAGKEKPFFLYLSYNAPHYPLQAKEEDIKLFNTGDEKRDIYLAMMKSLDEGVGKVLDKLESKGVAANTLVFFLSDNGGETRKGAHNGKLRSHKGMMFEGGHRVPFLVSWPRQLPAGATCNVPVMSFDIFATSVAAAGGKMPDDREYDSRNMLPFLKGKKKGFIRPTLFWTPGGKDRFAVRHQNWKLVSERREKNALLFDLSKDIGETTDLSAKHPDKVKELTELYTAWRDQTRKETAKLLEKDFKGSD